MCADQKPDGAAVFYGNLWGARSRSLKKGEVIIEQYMTPSRWEISENFARPPPKHIPNSLEKSCRQRHWRAAGYLPHPPWAYTARLWFASKPNAVSYAAGAVATALVELALVAGIALGAAELPGAVALVVEPLTLVPRFDLFWEAWFDMCFKNILYSSGFMPITPIGHEPPAGEIIPFNSLRTGLCRVWSDGEKRLRGLDQPNLNWVTML